ncbi:MAG TPA: hypothetical protein VLH38_03385 [Patescibacteria group bacterium]|nr:hypothetical protein [Patescibacteria group bacterium]
MRSALGVLFGVLLSILAASPAHIQKQAVRAEAVTKVAIAQHTSVQPQPEEEVAKAPEPAPQPVLTQQQQWMQTAGIAQSDWQYADYILSHESGWCPTKWEGQIGYCPGQYAETYSTENTMRGYGLCQSTPAIKMASVAEDWRTDPVTQMKWCDNYAQTCEAWRHYCGWRGAYDFWVANRHW